MPVMSRRPAKGAKRPERDSGLAPGRRSLGRAGFRRGGGRNMPEPVLRSGGERWKEDGRTNGVAGVAAADSATTATRRRFTAEHTGADRRRGREVHGAGRDRSAARTRRGCSRPGVGLAEAGTGGSVAPALGGKRGPKPRARIEENRWSPTEEVRSRRRAFDSNGRTFRVAPSAARGGRRRRAPGRSAADEPEDKASRLGQEVAWIVTRPRRGQWFIAPACRRLRRLPLDVLPLPGDLERTPCVRALPLPRALIPAERKDALHVLCSERFVETDLIRPESHRERARRGRDCARQRTMY